MKRYTANLSYLAALVLVAGIFYIYLQTVDFDFINIDDPLYIYENNRLHDGSLAERVKWAFTTFRAGNWHPMTWLSHMLDRQLFGLDPGGHHLMNVLLHAFNTLILFAVFHRMTGAFWRSIAVSAMFAWHPLHVESVAWVAERKDVLSTGFGLLTVLFYVDWTINGRRTFYWLANLMLALGLMAKPMLVTIPCLLLLLDFWPLGRITARAGEGEWKRVFFRRVLEKVPFLILATASSIVTVVAQKSAGALAPFEMVSLWMRILNALMAYLGYIRKVLWPVDLAVYYLHPLKIDLYYATVAAIVLFSITYLCVRLARRHPWLVVGWLWYLGMLVPVIGVVQVGAQSMADRYTYLPSVGLFVMIIWGGAAVLAEYRVALHMYALSILLWVGILALQAEIQARYWKDSLTLLSHTLHVSGGSPLVHNNLGLAKMDSGNHRAAANHFKAALRLNSMNYKYFVNLANATLSMGRYAESVEYYRSAIRLNPNKVLAYNNLGVALMRLGRVEEAVQNFNQALQIDPAHKNARRNLEKSDRWGTGSPFNAYQTTATH